MRRQNVQELLRTKTVLADQPRLLFLHDLEQRSISNIAFAAVQLCGLELAAVRDEYAVRAEIHFVLIEHLQLVVIWNHRDDGSDRDVP